MYLYTFANQSFTNTDLNKSFIPLWTVRGEEVVVKHPSHIRAADFTGFTKWHCCTNTVFSGLAQATQTTGMALYTVQVCVHLCVHVEWHDTHTYAHWSTEILTKVFQIVSWTAQSLTWYIIVALRQIISTTSTTYNMIKIKPVVMNIFNLLFL